MSKASSVSCLNSESTEGRGSFDTTVTIGWMHQQALSRSVLQQPPSPDDEVPFGIAALSPDLCSRAQTACAEVLKNVEHNCKFKSLSKLVKYPFNVEITALQISSCYRPSSTREAGKLWASDICKRCVGRQQCSPSGLILSVTLDRL